MRPPECDVCGADIEPGIDLIRFRSTSLHASARPPADPTPEPPPVGHPDDAGWFCGRHVAAALAVAPTMTYAEALAHVRSVSPPIPRPTPDSPPPTRRPSRPNEPAPAPSGPAPAPFDPRTHVLVEPSGEHHAGTVPAREPDEVHAVFRRSRHLLLDALAPDEHRGRVSCDAPHPTGLRRHLDYATAGDRRIFRTTDHTNVSQGRGVVRVERQVELDGRVEVAIRLTASTPDRLDQLETWVADDRYRPWVDAVVADLRTEPVDLRSPSPELVGVDLGWGFLEASHASRTPQQWVRWELRPTKLDRVVAILRDLGPVLAELLGRAYPTEFTTSTERRWTPIDRASPPNCPFDDTTTTVGSSVDLEIELSVGETCWSEHDVSSVDVHLALTTPPPPGSRRGETLVRVGGTGQRTTIEWIRLTRPTTPAVATAVRNAFAERAPDCDT